MKVSAEQGEEEKAGGGGGGGGVPPCLLVPASNWSGLNDSVMSTYVTRIVECISIPVFLLG